MEPGGESQIALYVESEVDPEINRNVESEAEFKMESEIESEMESQVTSEVEPESEHESESLSELEIETEYEMEHTLVPAADPMLDIEAKQALQSRMEPNDTTSFKELKSDNFVFNISSNINKGENNQSLENYEKPIGNIVMEFDSDMTNHTISYDNEYEVMDFNFTSNFSNWQNISIHNSSSTSDNETIITSSESVNELISKSFTTIPRNYSTDVDVTPTDSSPINATSTPLEDKESSILQVMRDLISTQVQNTVAVNP